MALPPLADVDYFQTYANVTLDDDEAAQVEQLLVQASSIARAFAGRHWVDDPDAELPTLEGVPDGADGVVAGMVQRATLNPTGVTTDQEQTGPFAHMRSYGADAAQRLYLTAADKLILKGTPRAFTIDTTPAASLAVNDSHLTANETISNILTEVPELEGAVINFPECDP